VCSECKFGYNDKSGVERITEVTGKWWSMKVMHIVESELISNPWSECFLACPNILGHDVEG
jgi:hypothetical protein